jgi:hypothetical protein
MVVLTEYKDEGIEIINGGVSRHEHNRIGIRIKI